tara:strand:+ start:835 stop:1122 length:288 start_codon:yes stop_codon:yes gene_type:complete
MPEFNPGQPNKWFKGVKDSSGRKGDTLDKIVHDSITAGTKTMNDFTSDYPYKKEVRNDMEYQSDEEAENAETQQEDLKAYLQQANARIDSLIDVL